jgi:hypothetical protein
MNRERLMLRDSIPKQDADARLNSRLVRGGILRLRRLERRVYTLTRRTALPGFSMVLYGIVTLL